MASKIYNESAISLRWLKKNLRIGMEASSLCNGSWQRVRDSMRATTQTFASIQDWISDFWICKTADVNRVGIGIVPKWDPPNELDEWPTLTTELLELNLPERPRLANHGSFASLLDSAPDVMEASSNAAVSEFYALNEAWREQGDLAMVQAEWVRAWLSTCLGNLLSSIALSPQTEHDILVAESRRRLLLPRGR